VNIGFRFVGDVVVDDIAQFFNIDTPGGDIRCNQYTGFPCFKSFQGFLPLILGLVAMNCSSIDIFLFEVPGNLVSTVFCS